MRKNIFFLLCILPTILLAQEKYYFSQLSLEDGLSQISVTAIHQDKHDLMWFGTRNGLNKYDAYDFDIFVNIPEDTTSISDNHILCIAEDTTGYLWIGTNNGLNRYDAKTNVFHRYLYSSTDSSSLSDNMVSALCYDSNDNLWVGTRNGINRYDTARDHFIHLPLNGLLEDNPINAIKGHNNKLYIGTAKKGLIIYDIISKEIASLDNLPDIKNNDIRAIYIQSNGNIWLGTHHNGIYFIEKDGSNIKTYSQNNGLSNDYVRSITETPEGNIITGTFNGLNVIEPNGKITQYKSSNRKEGALSHYSVYATFFDKNRTLWVGTYAGGINYYNPLGQKFHYYNPSTSQDEMLGIIGPMVETEDNLYIAAEGGGLLEFDKTNNDFKQYKLFEDKQDTHARNILKSLYLDGNRILCGTNLGTIYSFDLRTKTFKLFHDFKAINSIYQIGRLRTGELFIAGVNQVGLGILTSNGIFQNKFKLTNGDDFSFFNIRCMLEIEENIFLVGTRNDGLVYFDRDKGIVKKYKNIFPESYISAILKDSLGNIWIGTFGGGLCLLDLESEKVEIYNTKHGLLNNNICSLVEDSNQKLWISTTTGVSELDLNTYTFNNYSHTNGIVINEFTPHAGHKLQSGQIAFSGNNGFITFDPRKMSVNPYIPNLIFDKLYVNNSLIVPQPENEILGGQLYTKNSITLKHHESNIGIEYSALNYILSGKNEYKYYLEGFEKEWNNVGTRRIAYYTNIPPGEYIFKVKGSNNDGIWNQEENALYIKILPPFWKTWWAYILYSFAVLAILYFIFKNYNDRKKLKNNMKLEQARAEGQKEFHEARSKLFTNFSHELRTPLTLIMSPLGDMIEKGKDLPIYVKEHHKLMYNNTLRMLRLVNNLMNFQKNDNGRLKPQLTKTDFISFAKELTLLFNDLAKNRNIAYNQQIELENLEFFFDPNLMEKVFINILSNAFKNTEDGGEVNITIKLKTSSDIEALHSEQPNNSAATEYLLIKFTDSGSGIPEEDLDNIFAPFYQVAQNKHSSSGTGLGLSLSKSIVELHKGKIWAENSANSGAIFNCWIPVIKEINDTTPSSINNEEDIVLRKIELHNELKEKEQIGKFEHTLLIVEDNPNVRNYIVSLFSDEYNIILAPNGEMAVDKAKESMPNLIITDLMMPKVDGMQMCEIIKNNIETSHIPIIMITAKAMTEDILQGYKAGADAYITKPFESSILIAKVRSVLKERETLKQYYGKQFTILKDHVEDATSLDEQFMQKLYKLLDENISDVDFNLDDFSKDLGMSRSSFYRKIKSITDLTPSEFIKNFRLEMSAKLLTEASLSVSDVYVTVGFNSIAYFSTSFKAHFGVTPTEYIQASKQ